MKIITLTQGTPEWHEHRARHFNASDAPAMMGKSNYKSRDQLLREYATGLRHEPSEDEQARFDAGHRAEAAARPLAERVIGEDLFPVVGEAGKLSASFDGLTMDHTVNWEHKIYSQSRAAMIESGQLDDQHFWQIEQQMLISGAERTLFTICREDGSDFMYLWYAPEPGRAETLQIAWEQFAKDLASYTQPEATVELSGQVLPTLPTITANVSGSVIATNFDSFKAMALDVINSVNMEPSDDQEFADAESAVKWFDEVESSIKAAKEQILAQTVDIDALLKGMDDIVASARNKRLALDKSVKSRKEQIKGDIVLKAREDLSKHMTELTSQLGGISLPPVDADFQGAIKRKRNLASIQSAVNDELARAKIQASDNFKLINGNLQTFNEIVGERTFLFQDRDTLLLKQPEDLKAVVTGRIREYEDQQRAEAERKEREEAERREREAAAARAREEAAAREAQQSTEPEFVEESASAKPAAQHQEVADQAPPAEEPTAESFAEYYASTNGLSLSAHSAGFLEGLAAYAWDRDGIPHVGHPDGAIPLDEAATLFLAKDRAA